jgi:hypothetical protein
MRFFPPRIRGERIVWILAAIVVTARPLPAQIFLVNPSFEGEPRDATVPSGWFPCAKGSTPDILPGPWGVFTEPSDGDTYMGLITREDGSFESVGQRLPQPLTARECYTFKIDLAHSKTYAGYNNPIKVRVWLGRTRCAKDQLVFESPFIEHTSWKTYTVMFTPGQKSYFLLIEAYYKEGRYSHRGNVLLDNISPIRLCARAQAAPGKDSGEGKTIVQLPTPFRVPQQGDLLDRPFALEFPGGEMRPGYGKVFAAQIAMGDGQMGVKWPGIARFQPRFSVEMASERGPQVHQCWR